MRLPDTEHTNGLFGRLYMAAIKPFRHLLVCPALTRTWERAWRDRQTHLGPAEGTGLNGAASSGSAARRRDPIVTWAGRLIVVFGAAHTLGALTVEGAARHAGSWFRGELWGDDLAHMSPANSAYWLSVMSFGPPLILVGLTVLWLDRHGITPPPFIAWTLGIWTVVDTVLAGPGGGQGLILLLAVGLLLARARRAASSETTAPPPANGQGGHRTAA